MMLAILAESALRSLMLGSVVWVGLNLLRIQNPHVHMTCWVAVLVASLSMPLLMHWTTVTVTLAPLPLPIDENLWSAGAALPEALRLPLPSETAMPGPIRADVHHAVDWWALVTVIYALVAGLLLMRLAVGILRTWRLVRAAEPMNEAWVAKSDVRVSDAIGGPATSGSTILLPPRFADWDSSKRRAVLAHEGAHVANRDFYILLLASLNRAVFWFNPLAWWQLMRLAELAEIISDAEALEVVDDRLSYAEILLDLVQHVRPVPAGLEMARACTVRARVERILAATATPAKVGWRKRISAVAAIAPLVIVSAGTIAYSRPPLVTASLDSAGDAPATARRPQRADFYTLGRTSIFAIFKEGDDLFGQVTGQRKLRLSETADRTYSYASATGPITFNLGDGPSSGLMVRHNGRDQRADRIASVDGTAADTDARLLDSYIGWYQLAPNRVLTVSRAADRLQVQETGRSKFSVAADGVDAFSNGHDDRLIFLRDGAGVTQVLLSEPISGARVAPRVDMAKAKMVETEFARRVSEAPERFRDQTPAPGSKDAILRGIADLQHGTPNYDRMSPALAAKIRRQIAEYEPVFKALGAVESIYFRGVGPGGYDIYGVKFSGGAAEFRLLLGPDGKADDVIFRPDGNEVPGGVIACSQEQGLKSREDTAPITVVIYNVSGRDIQLYKLDAEGKRTAYRTIGDNISSSVMTYVDSPWLVADASGQCLEIVLPGQRTRFHTVEASRPVDAEHAVAPRTTPIAGSDEMLRRYIEELRQGEPNYDRMTSEVATQTRQQLPFNQAILNRLGPLRSVSFRGVSALGNDVYIAHFANGSAEWRIGLAKDGAIGRIALGPQY